MSNVFTFVLCIIIIVTIGQLAQTWLEQRKTESEGENENEDLLQQLERMEERIKVLERIVTEERYDLKREIDAL